MSVKGGSEFLLSLKLDARLGLFWTFLLPRFLTILAFLLSISTSSSSLLSTWFWLGLFTSFLDFFLGVRHLSWSSEDSDSLSELAVSVGGGGSVAVVAGWNVGDDGIEVVVSVWNVGGGGFGVFGSKWNVGDGGFGVFVSLWIVGIGDVISVWIDGEDWFGVIASRWIDGEGGFKGVISGCIAGEGGFGVVASRWIVGVVASGRSSLHDLQVRSRICSLEPFSTGEAVRSAELSARGLWPAGSFAVWQGERGGARMEF